MTQLARWIAEQAAGFDDPDALIEGVCAGLLAAGVPLWRISLATPAIDPTVRGASLDWIVGRGPALLLTEHGEATEAAFRLSPIHALIEAERDFAQWRLDSLEASEGYPLLHELRAKGATHYLLFMIPFAPGTALRGVAISLATQHPGGFRDEDLASVRAILPVLGLAVCKLSLAQTLRETLSTYLGPATGARVLDGQIRRGAGETVAAAILLTDLRSFTALTDRVDPIHVVGWLDEHFDALGDPVIKGGGEILKFLGDGFLAIFPVGDLAAHHCAVCEQALQAAETAMAANLALNARRLAAGLPTLDADVVLHFGDVVYGNVGTARRLDFTVIGRAVNEASRIEKLCDSFGQSLLISDSFARRCARPLTLVAEDVPLRGLDHGQRLWTTA